jgi:hypothetical protein
VRCQHSLLLHPTTPNRSLLHLKLLGVWVYPYNIFTYIFNSYRVLLLSTPVLSRNPCPLHCMHRSRGWDGSDTSGTSTPRRQGESKPLSRSRPTSAAISFPAEKNPRRGVWSWNDLGCLANALGVSRPKNHSHFPLQPPLRMCMHVCMCACACVCVPPSPPFIFPFTPRPTLTFRSICTHPYAHAQFQPPFFSVAFGKKDMGSRDKVTATNGCTHRELDTILDHGGPLEQVGALLNPPPPIR